MGYVTTQELFNAIDAVPEGGKLPSNMSKAFLDAAKTDGALSNFLRKDRDEYWNSAIIRCGPVDYDALDIWLNDFHAGLCEGDFAEWKALRPWEVTDLYSNLDQSKAWIGWEVETGWCSSNSRGRVINRFLNTYNHVCTDDEGYGYGVELTWCPKEVDYWDASSPDKVHPLLFVASCADEYDADEHQPDNMVGTHANVSTPTSRSLSPKHMILLRSALNYGLMRMSDDEKEEVFGRSELYAGFFVRGDDDNAWLEGKLFNSTYDEAVAKGYIRTGARLVEVVEDVAARLAANVPIINAYNRGSHITNMYEALTRGAVPIVSIVAGALIDGDCITDTDDQDDDFYDDEDGYDWCTCDACLEARGEC